MVEVDWSLQVFLIEPLGFLGILIIRGRRGGAFIRLLDPLLALLPDLCYVLLIVLLHEYLRILLIRGYAHGQLLKVEFILDILGTNDLLLSDVNHIAPKAFHTALDS